MNNTIYNKYFSKKKNLSETRDVSNDASRKFLEGRNFSLGSTRVWVDNDMVYLSLHNNVIAKYNLEEGIDSLQITTAGWSSNTTKDRLNALPGVSIYQKNYNWFLNSKPWDGDWAQVNQEGKWRYTNFKELKNSSQKRFKENDEKSKNTPKKDENELFDMSKLDDLQNVLDGARKDLSVNISSVDPKQMWSLIFGKIKSTVDEIISTEGLDTNIVDDVDQEDNLENDDPAGNGSPALDALGGDLGNDEGDTDQGDDSEASEGQDNSQAQDSNDLSALMDDDTGKSEGNNDQNPQQDAPKQESFIKLSKSIFKNTQGLTWADIKEITENDEGPTGKGAWNNQVTGPAYKNPDGDLDSETFPNESNETLEGEGGNSGDKGFWSNKTSNGPIKNPRSGLDSKSFPKANNSGKTNEKALKTTYKKKFKEAGDARAGNDGAGVLSAMIKPGNNPTYNQIGEKLYNVLIDIGGPNERTVVPYLKKVNTSIDETFYKSTPLTLPGNLNGKTLQQLAVIAFQKAKVAHGIRDDGEGSDTSYKNQESRKKVKKLLPNRLYQG